MCKMPKKQIDAIKSYENKNGEKLYKFKVYVGINENTGKKVEIRKQGLKSQAEAEAYYYKLKLAGVPKDKYSNKKMRLDELFDIWFQHYRSTVKESTAGKTIAVYKYHIHDRFGETFINKLAPAALQDHIDDLSTYYVNYKVVYNYLNRMTSYAVQMGMIESNPMLSVILPKKSTVVNRRDTTNNFYNRDELDRFLELSKTVNNRVAIYFLILASTGLRRSEALSLTWDDIDFENMLVDVNKTLTNGISRAQIISTPKSKMSIRKVPMSDNLARELRKYKIANASHPELFWSLNGGYVSMSKPYQWLQQVYKKDSALRHITVHGFRHTFATLLIESDPNIKPTDVQKIMGHETVQITLEIYTHFTDRSKEKVTNALNALNF